MTPPKSLRIAEPPILRSSEDLTAEWMSAALAVRITDVEVVPIGTGQMSRVLRVIPRYEAGAEGGPGSLIVKLASEDPAARGAGTAMGFYEAEVRFYREVAPRVQIPTPACLAATIDATDGAFTLVLEDRPHLTVGDMIAGGTVEQAELALRAVAGLQAPTWNAPALTAAPWLSVSRWRAFSETFPASLGPFLERFGTHLTDDEVALCERVLPEAATWLDRWSGPTAVQHGDYRLDNMLFGGPGEIVVFDWQTARTGPPLVDVGFYFGGCLGVEDRRKHADELLRGYHDRLTSLGVADYSWDECQRDYARYARYGLLGFVGTCLHVDITPRGEALYLAAFHSYAQQVLDVEDDDAL
jgi:hypothetical protein